MHVVVDFPPLYAEIAAAFGLDNAPYQPIFAWGDRIFNPHGIKLNSALVAHERVHGVRQGQDIVGWWRRYIDDSAFRLAEEIPAHVAEYEVLVLTRGSNRTARRKCLSVVAARLASPLYRYKPALSSDRARAHLKHAMQEAS